VGDVVGRLSDVEDQRLERLLLRIGRQVWAEVDALAIELMAGLADGRGGLVQSIPRARVKEEKLLDRSLMFSPAQMGLTEQGVADISAYLRSL